MGAVRLAVAVLVHYFFTAVVLVFENGKGCVQFLLTKIREASIVLCTMRFSASFGQILGCVSIDYP